MFDVHQDAGAARTEIVETPSALVSAILQNAEARSELPALSLQGSISASTSTLPTTRATVLISPKFQLPTPGVSVPPTPMPKVAPRRSNATQIVFTSPAEPPAVDGAASASPFCTHDGPHTLMPFAMMVPAAPLNESRASSPGPERLFSVPASRRASVMASRRTSFAPLGLDVDMNSLGGSMVDLAAIDATLPEIIPGLHIGSYAEVCSAHEVDERGISAFACIADNVGGEPFPPHAFAADSRRLLISVPDSAKTVMSEHLPDLFAFIDAATEANVPVVIYCKHGISRSVAFLLACVMRELGVKLEAALDYVRKMYPRADPNFAFICQLRSLEQGDEPRQQDR